jgi:Ni,Fe-hydrogenase I small subunit
MYPPELEVKEITDAASSASFLDLFLEYNDSGQLSTKIYDKHIINIPVCEVKSSSLMNLLIFYKLLKKL